jgi:hypothetical protein
MGFSVMLEDGRYISRAFVLLLLTYFRAVLWSISSCLQQSDKKKKLSRAIVVSVLLLCCLEQVPIKLSGIEETPEVKLSGSGTQIVETAYFYLCKS